MKSAAVLDRGEKPEIEGSAESSSASAGFVRRAGTFLLREFLEILPPTIFFFIGFNLIVLTTNLILADYGAQVANFMIATASALIVAKALLVANAMPVIRRYDRAPLIRPILFKTVFYWAAVSSNIGSGIGLAETMYSAALCRTQSRPSPGIAS